VTKVQTGVLTGLDAASVDVEVQVREGSPNYVIIGLGDSAVRESRDRVTSALRHSGYRVHGQVLINLAPAELKKEGSGFDVPIAVGILIAAGLIDPLASAGRSFHGELSLDGTIRGVRGTLALTIEALEQGRREIIVPAVNYHEAALIEGISVVGVTSLVELVEYLREGVVPAGVAELPRSMPQPASEGPRVTDVWGQESAKRALMIAAAGGHNLLMIGPPGCGKSMLAQAFGSILPPLERTEMLESVKIHSVAGLPIHGLLRGERPFRTPHHVVSDVGLIGGGSAPRPGEISLAHHGVLFLDEFPEFRRTALEAMRAPLEAGRVSITRAKASVMFPARFQLIAAMNPCPCGRLGSAGGGCGCSRNAIHSYLSKISQPILDRIDLHVELSAVPLEMMTRRAEAGTERDEDALRAAVQGARARQWRRAGKLNAALNSAELKSTLSVEAEALRLLECAAAKSHLSARGYMRVLRTARTIADVAGADTVAGAHIAEAVQFRCLERIERYCRGEIGRA
jgi:magnesium chelatase family protein